MPIPAPARFIDLRDHLHKAGIDAAYLSLTLEQYLALPENLPQHDWFLEPLDDHQAWHFRDVVDEFRQMVAERLPEGNGDDDEG